MAVPRRGRNADVGLSVGFHLKDVGRDADSVLKVLALVLAGFGGDQVICPEWYVIWQTMSN